MNFHKRPREIAISDPLNRRRFLQNSKGPRSGFGVKLGEGDCDWPAVMRALADIGYKGWATAEVGGGGAERLNDISRRMDRIFSGTT